MSAIGPDRQPRASFTALMFGNVAAPVFWIGQIFVGYGVTSWACYGSDHPTTIASVSALRTALYVTDAVAIVAALAGAMVSFLCWRTVRNPGADTRFAAKVAESRMRFMALWGMLSSLWFLGAIVFNAIASATVRLCAP
jgi:hypothetical protein